jgi:hypothetical protein
MKAMLARELSNLIAFVVLILAENAPTHNFYRVFLFASETTRNRKVEHGRRLGTHIES